MVLKAVFLDVGNTLLREEPARHEIYAHVAREHGLEVDGTRMRELMRSAHGALPLEIEGAYRYSDPWFRRFIARIFGEELGQPDDVVEALTEELFARFEDPSTFRLFAGVDALIERLREHDLCLGIVSNWSARLPRLLDRLGLAERVDFVLSSAIERVEKPDAAIFSLALERAGVSPREALHAGDHPEKDALGSRAVGLLPVLVDHQDELDPARVPDEVDRVRSLDELADYVVERAG